MTTTSAKLLTFFFLLSITICQIMARPQSAFDSQENEIPTPEFHPSDIRKFYSTMNELPNPYDDELLNRFQLQLLNAYTKNFPQALTNQRLPMDYGNKINEQKRHPRYRQCYFNPISCFRK